jgi:hypothetical protein
VVWNNGPVCPRRSACAGVLALVATLVGAAPVVAGPAPPPVQQAVAIVRAGVVWYDNGVVRLIGHDGKRTVLARWKQAYSDGPPQISSSGVAVALAAGDRFMGGIPPARLSLLSPGRSDAPGKCPRWQPELHSAANFVVAGDQLVIAAEPTCGEAGSSPQPLFAKDLRGGPWRVLRRLPGTAPPMLAADGSLLAIGVQRSPSLMNVRVVDVDNGSTVAHATLPDGYLAFAAANRLVVSVPTFGGFPFYYRLETPGGSYGYGPGSLGGEYRVALYTTDGRRIASMGTEGTQPQLSALRRATVEDNSQSETQTVSVQRVPGGATRGVIGLNAPARQLEAFAWRWPWLALIETTSAALPDGQFNCSYGTYGPPSPAFLHTFNIARPSPLVPAPQTPPQPTPQQVFATCGGPRP